MSRDIKLRIYDPEEDVWHYSTIEEIISHLGFDYGVPKNVMAFSKDSVNKWLGVYTGHKDCEDIEIYESIRIK